MAVGDDAAAAGLDVVLGTVLASTIDTEINRTRDYLAQRTPTVLPVAKGGTGASGKAGARINLGFTYGFGEPAGGADGDIYFKIV